MESCILDVDLLDNKMVIVPEEEGGVFAGGRREFDLARRESDLARRDESDLARRESDLTRRESDLATEILHRWFAPSSHAYSSNFRTNVNVDVSGTFFPGAAIWYTRFFRELQDLPRPARPTTSSSKASCHIFAFFSR